jgi:DNA-binding LytR/AlgR family response regulator
MNAKSNTVWMRLSRRLAAHYGAVKWLAIFLFTTLIGVMNFNTSDIMFISAEEKYVKLQTETESYLLHETMTNLEQRLDPAKFARIHRSYLVNLDFIQEKHPWSHGDNMVILKNGTKLAASRRFRDILFRVG